MSVTVSATVALFALLDPDIHLVNLSGAAGSGKTILALAAAIAGALMLGAPDVVALLLRLAGWGFVIGTVLFSGSIYL